MRKYKYFFLVLSFLFCGRAHALISSLVADTQSGFVIESKNADVPQPPASLTKLMTLYLTFGALDNGLLKMEDKLPISSYAASQPKSHLNLQEGDTITVREAVMALIIKSANDVAVVLAEALAHDEKRFAELMTQTAQSLGLKDTVFKNASGLHAIGQVSTARDMAILTIALIHHYPQYYTLFATPSFQYKGQTYYSHNAVLREYKGAEGLKTGYVSAVGYNIISTAKHGDDRLVSVILGGENPTKRDQYAIRLLDKGFHQVDIQRNAEKTGKLQGAFNPLNRKAFISKPPVELYLPVMKVCVSMCKNRIEQAFLKPKSKPILTVVDKDNRQGWEIQVGAFEGTNKAKEEAEKALAILGGNRRISTPQANERFYRARIQGFLSGEEATKACQRLKDAHMPCFTVSPL